MTLRPKTSISRPGYRGGCGGVSSKSCKDKSRKEEGEAVAVKITPS